MRLRYGMLLSTLVAVAFLVMVSPGVAQHSGHLMVTPDNLQWTDVGLSTRGYQNSYH
jgi:hypothetical protein